MAENETKHLVLTLGANEAMSVDGAVIRNLSARPARLSIRAPATVEIHRITGEV